MIKAMKILQGHKVTTKKQRMQKNMPKQQSTAHNSKHDTWTLVEYDKSHQNIAGTQGNYEKNKECRRKCQSNKVLRTTAKMIHELLSNMIKVIKRLRARRMIRLPPERYDLNRPLVSKQDAFQQLLLNDNLAGDQGRRLQISASETQTGGPFFQCRSIQSKGHGTHWIPWPKKKHVAGRERVQRPFPPANYLQRSKQADVNQG